VIPDAISSHDQLYTWAWRVPVLCALPLGAVGAWLRTSLEHSPAFKTITSQGMAEKAPLTWTIRHAWRAMLLCIGMVVMLNVAYYTVLKYMPSYLKTELGISKFDSDLVSLCVLVGIAILLPILGALSDWIGRRPVWLMAS